MRRREFLEGAAMSLASVTLFGLLGGPALYREYKDKYDSEREKKEIEDLEKKLSDTYGIEINWDSQVLNKYVQEESPGSERSAEEIQSDYVKKNALLQIQREIMRYPPDTLSSYVNSVSIMKSVKIRKESKGGYALQNTGKIAITIDSLFVDHHIFLSGNAIPVHYFDHEVGHNLAKDISEEKWAARFPKNKYWYFITPEKPQAGFARAYGSLNYAEDIATSIELLFHSNIGKEIVKDDSGNDVVARDHPYVKEKMEELKKHYNSKMNLDDRYWELLKDRNMNWEKWKEYWTKLGRLKS